MEYYALKEDSYIYSDCDFSSKVVSPLKKETVFCSDEEIGAWMHIILEDQSASGWIYHYNQHGSDTLVPSYKVGSEGVRIGDLINIPSTMTYAKDYFGNILQVKDSNMTERTFVIKDVILDPTRVKVFENNRNYWFTLDKIFDITAQKRLGISLMAAAPEQSAQSGSSLFDFIGGVANSSYETVEDVFNLNKFSLFDGEVDTPKADRITAAALDGLKTSSIRGIFGCPYQFMPTADLRITNDVSSGDALGVKYAEKIVTKMPVLMMLPGIPEFMRGYSDEDKSKMIGGLANKIPSDELDKLLNQNGQYYDLYPAWSSYYQYVNPLCQIAATLLGIGDVTLPYGTNDKDNKSGAMLKNYRWEYASSEPIKEALNFKGGCAFYVNSETQVSESFSSETGQPAVASKINAVSDKAREMLFLLGASTKKTLNQNINLMAQGRQDTTSLTGSDSIMGSIMDGMGSIFTGGKMTFPELWTDSAFSRDYNVNIKLVSPDCDRLSLYMNIIVPLIHLMGFAAPRALGFNSYTSPFLVRAYYKGFFNINMGLITNMSINKGGEGYWTYAGIPTEVEVSFTIKDLYGLLMLTMSNPYGDGENRKGFMSSFFAKSGFDILTNTVLMDYISNLCGININQVDIPRSLTLYKQLFWESTGIIEFSRDQYNRMQQWIQDKELQLYDYAGRGGFIR